MYDRIPNSLHLTVHLLISMIGIQHFFQLIISIQFHDIDPLFVPQGLGDILHLFFFIENFPFTGSDTCQKTFSTKAQCHRPIIPVGRNRIHRLFIRNILWKNIYFFYGPFFGDLCRFRTDSQFFLGIILIGSGNKTFAFQDDLYFIGYFR